MMLLLPRHARSTAINLTYIKFAFPSNCCLQNVYQVQILVNKRALARNICSTPQSTQPNNNFNSFPIMTIQICLVQINFSQFSS